MFIVSQSRSSGGNAPLTRKPEVVASGGKRYNRGMLNWLKTRLGFTAPQVLIVEDDQASRLVLSMVIKNMRKNIRVTATETVVGARELLAREKFSLVIADCLLANDSNGIDLLRHCQQAYPRLPFILMSGLTQETIMGMLPKSTAPFRFLPKPVDTKTYPPVIADFLKL